MTEEELDFDITKYHKCLSDLYWYGCYDSDIQYKGFVTPESYAHPAKASFLLIERIFKHLEKLELLKEGMTVLDFMAGSFRVPLLASLRGYKSIGVELETHFTKMGHDNKKFAENKIGRKLDMEIIKGDSRELSKLLNKSDVAVVSPPFAEQNKFFNSKVRKNMITQENITQFGIYNHNKSCKCNWCIKNKNNAGEVVSKEYSDNPSNIGNLKYKQMVGVVSPPYQDMPINTQGGGGKGQEFNDAYEKWKKTGNWQDFQKELNKQNKEAGYSQNPENIGNLKDTGSIVGITSPPYSDVNNRSETDQEWRDKAIKEGRLPKIGSVCSDSVKHSDNPQNIANLKDTSFVGITSPPYAGQLTDEGGNQEINQVKNRPHPYNKNKDDRVQIGNFTRNEWGDIVGITSPPKKESEWCECDD